MDLHAESSLLEEMRDSGGMALYDKGLCHLRPSAFASKMKIEFSYRLVSLPYLPISHCFPCTRVAFPLPDRSRTVLAHQLLNLLLNSGLRRYSLVSPFANNSRFNTPHVLALSV